MGCFASVERRRLWTRGRIADHDFRGWSFLCAGASAGEAASGANCRQLKRDRSVIGIVICTLALAGLARADKLSFDERMEIERGLTAEFATAKVTLPISKKILVIHSDGSYDQAEWKDALIDSGPAARLGDQVQITKVTIEANKILLEINGGGKKGGHWYDHVEVGMSGTSSVGQQQNTAAPAGARLALVFPGPVPSVKSAELRQMLAPVLDFEKHSASQQYVDTLPEPVKKAIKEQHAIVGMDKDQVLLAMGRPHNKSRETNKDGDEVEDWVYGDPPGKMTFVQFNEGKVTGVHDSYANIGGTTAPPLDPPR
jgi:hypothetical protein